MTSEAPMPKAKLAGARHHLTIAEKNQLRACHRAQPGMTQELLRDWAHSKFGKWVGRSTIGKITSSPDETCVNQDAKRNQSGRFPDMERELFAFVRAASQGGSAAGAQCMGGVARDHTVGEHSSVVQLHDAVLWAKANEILKRTLGEQHSVSVGWVQRFKKRHGLHKGYKRPLHHHPDVHGALPSTPPVVTDTARTDRSLLVGDVLAVSTDGFSGDHDVVGGDAPQLPNGVGDGADQRSSEARATKSSVRKQFLAVDDILLLTQALRVKPWTLSEPMDGWREVTEALRRLESFSLEKSAGACQARVSLLVEHARAGNSGALCKSGSSDEVRQKKQLLAEIVTDLERVGATSTDASARKRPASELAPAASTLPESSRRRTTPTEAPTAVIRTADSAALVDEDDVTRRLALLETKLELELAVQRRNAEQQVRELGKQYQQQLERHQRQFDQQLASIQQQQVTIIELLKVVVEKSASQGLAPRRPE